MTAVERCAPPLANPSDPTLPRRRHRLRAAAIGLLLALFAGWSVQLVVLEGSVSVDRQYWSQPRGQAGGLLYVALGDSVAQGIGASRPDRGYVGLVAENLRRQSGEPVQVINLSRSGATISDVLDVELPALHALGRRPDLVTLDIGGNDVRRGYDAARFSRDVEVLTAALPEGTVLADVPYFMHGKWEARARQAAQTMTTAAQRHQLAVVGVHEAQRREGWSAMVTEFARPTCSTRTTAGTASGQRRSGRPSNRCALGRT